MNNIRIFGKALIEGFNKSLKDLSFKDKRIDGTITYNRILNATEYEVNKLLNEYGYTELIGCSRYYIADRMKEKAKIRGRDYYV